MSDQCLNQELQKIVGAVNTAPKALAHLILSGGNHFTPAELDSAMSEMQGDDPAWKVSRNFTSNMLDGHPVDAGTVIKDPEKPVNYSLTPFGRDIAVPIAAKLIMIAYGFGVDTTMLVGINSTPQKKPGQQTLSPLDIRYQTIKTLLSFGSTSFTTKGLSEETGVGYNSTLAVVNSFTSAGFTDVIINEKSRRNTHAVFELSPNTSGIDDNDPLQTALVQLASQEIDALKVARIMKVDAKYHSCSLADKLDALCESGLLLQIKPATYRNIIHSLSSRGKNALTAVCSIYSGLENPNKDFKASGTKLAEMILDSPEIVRSIMKFNGRIKHRSATSNDGVVPIGLVGLLKTHGTLDTATIESLLGVSRTAALDALTNARANGYVTSKKNGRGYEWTIK